MPSASLPESEWINLCERSLEAYRQGKPLPLPEQKALLLALLRGAATRQEQDYLA